MTDEAENRTHIGISLTGSNLAGGSQSANLVKLTYFGLKADLRSPNRLWVVDAAWTESSLVT